MKLGLAATDDEGALWLALAKINAATEETLDSTIAWLVAEGERAGQASWLAIPALGSHRLVAG
jgi:hypothetical protein